MKRILYAAVVAALCSSAYPKEVARASHPMADLVLSDESGDCASGTKLAAIFYKDGSPPIRGCWFEAQQRIWVLWEDGDLLGYRKALFGGMES